MESGSTANSALIETYVIACKQKNNILLNVTNAYINNSKKFSHRKQVAHQHHLRDRTQYLSALSFFMLQPISYMNQRISYFSYFVCCQVVKLNYLLTYLSEKKQQRVCQCYATSLSHSQLDNFLIIAIFTNDGRTIKSKKA